MKKLSIIFVLMMFIAQVLLIDSVHAVPANKLSPAADLKTTAQSAVLMDENGRVLFEKDSHKRLPPASVTKSMTLLLAVEAVEQGKVNMNDEVYSTQNAWRQGGSQIWLEPGEKMSLQQLMIAMAVVSANDAAVATMEHIFGSEQAAVDAMNQRAESLGLKDTKFVNVNGLPVPGHYMSAYDTALIVNEAIRHPLYMELCGIKEYWLRDGKNWLVNTNKLLWWYPGADGLKTGWTEEAKYCFAGTAQRDGLRLISVVFATNEPRSHLRESMSLLDWGFANYQAMPIIVKGSFVENIKIKQGTRHDIKLIAANNLTVIVPKKMRGKLQTTTNVQGVIDAPVNAGEKYGELIVSSDGEGIGKVDLIAAESVEKANFLTVFSNIITKIFSVSY